MSTFTDETGVDRAVGPRQLRPLTDQEAEEFVRVLGLDAALLRPGLRRDGTDAFGKLPSYESIVDDPIKGRLARSPEFYHQIKADLALELLGRYFAGRDLRSLRVLDVGCGTGGLMRCLEPSFDVVRGCDPSLYMVRTAGDQAVYMHSPSRLPFESRSFDVALCACVYHHIDPHLRVAHLGEIQRVLRYGGVLMVFEHNPYNPLTRLIVNRCPIDSAAELVSAGQMKKLLESAGYVDVRNRHYLFFPERLYRRVGQLERLLSISGLGGQYCTVGRKALVRVPAPISPVDRYADAPLLAMAAPCGM